MKLKFYIISNNSILLKNYCQIFGKYLDIFTIWIHTEPHFKGYCTNITSFKYLMHKLIICKKKYTVIRSIHIYNKSREQFKRLIYKLLFYIFLKELSTAESFLYLSSKNILKKLLKWLPEGLSLQYNEFIKKVIQL